ncbi:uncharacterized transporter slc-17.2-like [Mercenaria mercenaria]|uniref:uncharacterized transporter slc-17.2-like n=1 Tax=Mercenaria mercenaria TaxID=6596 RepID=UPI00234EF628|nr:uncharacterized transporter slc-17.2-like [Mercenaria mercenaria]
MVDEAKETDKLDVNGGTIPKVKYKDPHTFLCSTRWRMAAYIFLSFAILYMHRVNLSLAIVCMVDTTHRDTTAVQINKSEIVNNYSIGHTMNSSEEQNSNYTPAFLSNASAGEKVTFTVENEILTQNIERECGSVISEENKDWTPELHWKKSEISFLLSSYFYGSFFTQIPAGTISDIFGGKHVITAAMLLSTVCSLLTPICARTSIILMFVVRITVGLAGGSVIPAGMSMINSWSTPNERSLMIAVGASGLLTGAIITFLTSGLLCAYGFDNGWASIFYIHGCITALFTCLWFFEGHSRPSHHPRISEKELEYIETSRSHTINTKRPKTPWKRFLISKPQWATFIAHFCFNWSFFTVLINVPLFLKEVLKFDVKSNGLYSALPFVFQIISALLCGKLSGVIIKRKIIGHLATRRIFSTVCQLGIATCLVSAGYVSCEVRHIAVILLCLTCTFAGFAYGGFLINHPEYAGQFAGTAFGITNAGGVISSLVASMMAGLLTPNGLQEEWQRVFYMAAGINIVGAIAFVLCSDVYLQPWARNPEDLTIEVNTRELQDIKPLDKENDITASEMTPELQEITPLNNGIGLSART